MSPRRSAPIIEIYYNLIVDFDEGDAEASAETHKVGLEDMDLHT